MSVYTGESRGELLGWINGLLGTEITKIESLGSGAVYCQIMDSIFGNLPMTRVKYNARADYEYLDNFKILQACFKKNGVDKPIPVDKLIKCKMQDNLEFCQWMKKYWDAMASGQMYDAAGRSGGQVVAPPAAPRRAAGTAAARTVSRSNPISAGAGRAVSNVSSAKVQELTTEIEDLNATCEHLEGERAFYFSKLQEVEVLVNARTAIEGISEEERQNLAAITAVLYATADAEEEGQLADEPLPADEETY